MTFRHKLTLALLDIVLVFLGLILALGLRLDFDLAAMERFMQLSNISLYVGVSMLAVVSFSFFGLYDKVWRYAGVHELLSTFYAVFLTASVWEVCVLLAGGTVFPRTSTAIAALLWLSACGGTRLILRLMSVKKGLNGTEQRRALVVGVDDGGEVIIRELERENSGFSCIGLVDNDLHKRRLRIHGVPVLGTVDNLADLIKQFDISFVIMSGRSPSLVRAVVQACAKTPQVRMRVVPSVADLLEGNVKVNSLREVQIEDLLDRDPVDGDLSEVSSYIRGQRVLVTGAGGSIGSEICRQVVKLGAAQVIMMGRGENSIHEIGIELRNAPVVQFIGNLRDKARMTKLFERFKPQVVFHTAAHKHVPLMELSPAEAVANNVFGTLTLLELAQQYGVQKLISISTDKAVNPTSVMGATKRLAELILASRRIPGFAAVRFGNVLGSRGSVIPTFKKQIAKGGPVTVTDENMTRFFMTIPEAVGLVLQAGALAQGGEIYVLDMGKPVKIIDLARNLIRLSGFEPDIDIPIKIVGLRPGEKLYEELTNSGEDTEPTKLAKITKVTTEAPPKDWPGEKLAELRQVANEADDESALRLLVELVPHFTSEQLNKM
ncbi:MAG: SDR family NAD(P)-dependent oxidoreductase [Candidatus Bruticola sp.]